MALPEPTPDMASASPPASFSDVASCALERVIRPIVEGQIKSFLDGHPEMVEAVSWYSPRADRKRTLINSIAKRIIRDLLCAETRMRLVAAIGGNATAVAANRAPEMLIGERGAGGGRPTAPGKRLGGLARAASMTPERRSEIARMAAHSRWGTEPKLRTPQVEKNSREAI